MRQPGPDRARHRAVASVRSFIGAITPSDVAAWLGALVAMLGLAVLASWIDGRLSVIALSRGWATMKANTALTFMLAGAALWLATARNVPAVGRTAGRICAGLTAMIGLGTLAQDVFGTDFGIDRLIALVPANEQRPGRMSQVTAFSFALIGPALLACRPNVQPALRLSAQIAAMPVFIAAYFAIVGHVFDARFLYEFPGFSSVAVHTATAMLLLSLGTMMALPDTGVMRLTFSRYAGGNLVRRLLPVALIVPPVLVWLRLELQRRGLISAEVGVALMVAGTASIFATVIMWQGTVINALDIERRRLDAASVRQRYEQRFHGLLEAAPDAMVVTGQDGHIVLVNAQAEKLFGFSREEMLGRPVEVLIPERLHAQHRAHRAQYATMPKPRPMGVALELYAVRKDGSEVPVEISLAGLQSEEGVLIMTAVRDIAERRQRSDELKVAMKAAEDARAMAEQANRAKSDFLASMSHELRTPLTAISGFAQLLILRRDRSTPERQAGYAQTIVEASGQLTSIIDDILDMARIEAGQVSLNCETVDCVDVMSEVCRTLEVAARQRGIVLAAEAPGDRPCVRADRARLVQVLLNLASNAIKYNVDNGRVLLTAVAGADMVRLTVSDTGRGIPAERHGQVFEPFNRLGAETGPQQGTGLGLAITRRLVHAMQGQIGFESAVGAGSKFWVDLPRANDIAATGARESTMPAAPDAVFWSHLAGDSVQRMKVARRLPH